MRNLVRPGHRARPVLPPARPRRPPRWRRSPRRRRCCSRTWPTPSRRSRPDPRGAAGHDREVAAHDRRGDQLVPRAAAVPGRLRRPLARGCARPRTSCRARCRRSTARFRVGHARPAAHGGPQRAPRGALVELEDLFENPNTLLALRDLRTALAVTRPAIEFIAPVPDGLQLLRLLLPPARRAPVGRPDRPDGGGTVQNQGVKVVNNEQPNTYASIDGVAAVGHAAGRRSRGRTGPARQAARPRLRARPTSRPSTPRATPTARTARTAIRTARSARPLTRGDARRAEAHGLPTRPTHGRQRRRAPDNNSRPLRRHLQVA